MKTFQCSTKIIVLNKKTASASGSVSVYSAALQSGCMLEPKSDVCLFICPNTQMSPTFLLAVRLCGCWRFEDWLLFSLLFSSRPMNLDLAQLSLSPTQRFSLLLVSQEIGSQFKVAVSENFRQWEKWGIHFWVEDAHTEGQHLHRWGH